MKKLQKVLTLAFLSTLTNIHAKPLKDIWSAAYQGDDERIAELLQSGEANLEDPAPINGYTPLHYAAAGNQQDTVTFLVKLGANIDSKDFSGKSPADIAFFWFHHKLAAHLINLGSSFRLPDPYDKD